MKIVKRPVPPIPATEQRRPSGLRDWLIAEGQQLTIPVPSPILQRRHDDRKAADAARPTEGSIPPNRSTGAAHRAGCAVDDPGAARAKKGRRLTSPPEPMRCLATDGEARLPAQQHVQRRGLASPSVACKLLRGNRSLDRSRSVVRKKSLL
jgi:hypothetical protein